MSAPALGPVLGIDLGTTNSVVAIADGTAARVITDPEGNRLIPSCVSFAPDGTIVVGHAARERRLVDAENTVYSIKRLIGRPYAGAEVQRAKKLFPFALQPSPTGAVQVRTRKGDYSLPEVSAMVLRHLRKVAELALGAPCQRAVITVPANFNELQRSATQAAGKVAGLDVMRILNEPTAATLAYGYGKDRPETVAVYDLGGGTFDITILHLDGDVFEVISTAGDTFLGGDDVDLVIAERMVEECMRVHGFDARTDAQAFERMRAAAEWAKCQLSSVVDVDLTLEELFQDRSGRAVDFSFHFGQAELEARARPLVARSFDVVAEALREAGKRPKEIDSVVMVGGSTRIPLVRAMVAEHFGKPPRVDIDPDLVVAQGAAIHAWTLAGRPDAPRAPVLGPSPLRHVTVASPIASASPTSSATPGLPRRGTIVGDRPRGPAFAPEESPLAVVMPVGPRRIAQALAGPRPVVDGDPLARTSLESVAILQPPAPVGAIGGAGLLLDLDDPLVREAAKRTTRDPSPRAGAPRIAPAAIDAPFSAPNTKGLVGARVDAPFESPSRPVAPSATRRDPTMPFGLPSRSESAPLDDPFGDEDAFSPEDGGGGPSADPFADIPLPLPEPQPFSEPSGLFEIETESVPPPAAPQPSARVAPPPPPPPRPLPPAPPRAPSPPGPEPELRFEPPPPPLAPRIADLPMPSAPAPLLMDVTPLSLSLETAGGYCAAIVPRNAPLPAEKSRVFSTARDGQEAVEVRICQGESIQFGDNQLLGTLVLDGIRRAARGTVRIEITFLLDASGILDVRAVDLDTRNEQHTRIALQGGIDAAEIEAMRRRQDRELS